MGWGLIECGGGRSVSQLEFHPYTCTTTLTTSATLISPCHLLAPCGPKPPSSPFSFSISTRRTRRRLRERESGRSLCSYPRKLPLLGRVRSSSDKEDSQSGNKDGWVLFEKWKVPWDAKTVAVSMSAVGFSFLCTGLAVSVVAAQLGFRRRQMELDEQAIFIFTSELLQTIFGLSVLDACLNSYKPLSMEFFKYDWKDPFNLQRGWLLWGVLGIGGGAAAVLAAGVLTTTLNGQPLPREDQDALLQLLPIIGNSNISTALLVGVTGVLAPYLEETVFRGFLMVSLTKWMPTSAAVILSAAAFALAHFTPGEIPQLFALGVVLGFAYARTQNLLTPILIHAFWNSGVVLLLTFLRLQGYDLKELI